MSLRTDAQGLESLPLRLMVVAVIASLSIVPAANALETLENREFVRRAATQLDTIVATAQAIAVQGLGNTRTLELDFSGDASIRFSRLALGDSEGGPLMSSVVLELSTTASIVRSATEPAVWICSYSFGPVEISAPVFELQLEAVLHDRTVCVAVEVI